MKHFTSYYANYRNIPEDYMCVGITSVCPDGFSNKIPNFTYTENNILTPSVDLQYKFKSGEIEINEYKKEYVSGILEKVQTIMKKKDFPTYMDFVDDYFGNRCLTQWRGLVFLSYEKPEEFSHRHILRRLMKNVYKIPCTEYGCAPFEVWGELPDSNQGKQLF